MKPINRAHLFSALLLLALFSPLSKAVIITSYTGLFDDGSKLVVDLKGYDYGAAPILPHQLRGRRTLQSRRLILSSIRPCICSNSSALERAK